jgi:hypothetical protein
MRPKEKAQELLNNFYQAIDGHWNQVPVSKQCALIAVDEIISLVGRYTNNYWQEVKQEIEKL